MPKRTRKELEKRLDEIVLELKKLQNDFRELGKRSRETVKNAKGRRDAKDLEEVRKKLK